MRRLVGLEIKVGVVGADPQGASFLQPNQLACGTLNRYLLIPKRLIFDSSVRAGSANWLPRPLVLRSGRGSLPARLQSFPFPAYAEHR